MDGRDGSKMDLGELDAMKRLWHKICFTQAAEFGE